MHTYCDNEQDAIQFLTSQNLESRMYNKLGQY